MNTDTSTRLCSLSASLLFIFFVSTVRGADCTWTGAGDDARWANPQNWSGNTVPSGNGDQAFFPAGTPTACLVDTSMSIKCIYFRNPGMTLTIANSVNLHFDNQGALTILAEQDAVIDGEGTISFSVNQGENYADNQARTGKTLTILAKITGPNGFEHNGGGGTIILANAANDQTGSTLITAAGVLSVPSVANAGIPSPLGTGNAFKFHSAPTTFRYTGAGDSTDRAFYQNAGGSQDVTIEHAGSGTLTFTGPLLSGNNNTHAFIFNVVDADAVIENTGVISNGGTGNLWLYKQGAGQQILSATNTYIGNTLIDAGTLALTSSGAISENSLLQMRGGRLSLNVGTPADAYIARLGSLQVGTGDSSITIALGATSAEVTFASLTHLAGTIDFAGTGLGTTTKIFITNQEEGLIGPWATVNNGTALAAYSTSQGVHAADLPVQTLSALGPSTITNNVNDAARITMDGTAGGILLASDPTAVALLSQETASNAVVSLEGKTLILPRAQIVAGTGSLTLGDTSEDGMLTAPASTDGNLILANQNAPKGSTLTVNAAITNNGETAVSLNTSGPGTVILAGPVAHSGTTTIGAGILTFETPADETRDLPSGAIGGNGSLTLTGGGTVVFPNVANTYTGTTTIEQGTARILNSGTFGSTRGPTIVKNGAAIDFRGTGNNNIVLGNEMIYAEGEGPDNNGALVNNGTYEQYWAISYLTLTGPVTVGGSARLDMRGDNADSTFLNLNGHGITKKGPAWFGLTQTTVTNDQNKSFIDIQEGNVTIEANATLSGGASNSIRVRNNTSLDFYNLQNPINWTVNLEDGGRINTRSGNSTNMNILAGPVTLAGTATLTSGGTMIDTIMGVISGTGPLVKDGDDKSITYLRNTNNTWTGGTTLAGGMIYAPEPATLPNYDTDVTFTNRGCLVMRVSDAAATQPGFSLAQINSILENAAILTTGCSIGFDTPFEDADYTYEMPAIGIGVRKFGANTLTLSGIGENLGPIHVYGGTLDLSPTSRYLGDQSIIVGNSTSTADPLATLVVTNAAEITTYDRGKNIGGQPQAIIGDTGRGVLHLSDNAKVAARLVVGNAGGSVGAVYQTGGTFHNTGGGGNDGRIGASGYGYYLLAGGSLTNNGWSQIGTGTSGLGILEQTGGQFAFNNAYDGYFGVSRGGTGIAHLSGGTFFSSVTLWVGDSNDNNGSGGYAAFTVADTAAVTINGPVDLGNRDNMTAMLNLKGGTLNANRVWRANRNNTEVLVNWNGGLFRPNNVGITELFNGGVAGLYPEVTLYAGGAFTELYTNTMSLAVNTPLRAPIFMGVVAIPVATPGAGYLGAPHVQITGGGGKGAAAFAHVDLVSGTLTSVEIVSPGTGYTSAPTVTLVGGGATTAATLGAPVMGLSDSGGLTKLGPGVLILNATNTYTGTTEVREGTLRLGGGHAINPRSPVSVTGGRLDLGGGSLTNESISVSSGEIVNGFIATAVLEKDGPDTFDLRASLTFSAAHAQPTLIPGLWEGRLPGSMDTTSPNPETSIQLTTRAVNGACGSGGTINGAQWPDNTTYIYSGYIWNRASTNVTWTFAENFDDSVLLRIDDITVLDNGQWNTPTKANVTLSPGAHLFEARFGQGGGGAAGNVSGWWTDSSFSFGVDFQGRDEENIANYTLLTDPGDGSLLTLNLPETVEEVPERLIVNVNEGTLRSSLMPGGLWEGRFNARWNITAENPGTSLQLTTRAVNGWCNENGFINGMPWPNDTTYVYSGYIWNRASTNVTWTFAENFDDQVLLRIDDITVLDNASYNTPTTGNIELSPGPHRFDVRFGQGNGGAGAVSSSWWNDNSFAFGIDFQGRGAETMSNYVIPADPGNGALFTPTLVDPLTYTSMLENAAVNLALGAVLDLNNEAQKIAEVAGIGTLSNGTLTAGSALSPAGDTATGSLTLHDVTLAAGTTYRVTIDGMESDCLLSSETLDLSGLTVVPATENELSVSTYVIAQATGGFTGAKPTVSGFPPKYKISVQGTEMLLTSQYGTLFLFQ